MIYLALLFLLWAVPVYADTATLTWKAPPERDLNGYKLYQHDAANQWIKAVVLDKTKTTYTTPNITTPGKLFWTLTAVDVAGNESKASLEVSKVMVGTVVPPPPQPVGHCVAATVLSPKEITIKGVPCVN